MRGGADHGHFGEAGDTSAESVELAAVGIRAAYDAAEDWGPVFAIAWEILFLEEDGS